MVDCMQSQHSYSFNAKTRPTSASPCSPPITHVLFMLSTRMVVQTCVQYKYYISWCQSLDLGHSIPNQALSWIGIRQTSSGGEETTAGCWENITNLPDG